MPEIFPHLTGQRLRLFLLLRVRSRAGLCHRVRVHKGWHGGPANAHDHVAEDIASAMATTIGPGFGQVGGPDPLAPVILQSIQRLLSIAASSAAVTRSAVEGFCEMFLAF